MEELLAKGTLSTKTFKYVMALLELDRDKTLVAVAQTVGVNYSTNAQWRDT